MKVRIDKQYLKTSAFAAGTIIISGIIILITANIVTFDNTFGRIIFIFKPILCALTIAYLTNLLVRFFELKIFNNQNNNEGNPKKLKKIYRLSFFLSAITAIFLAVLFLEIILPNFLSGIIKLTFAFDELPVLLLGANENIAETFGSKSLISRLITDFNNKFIFNLMDFHAYVTPHISNFYSRNINGIFNNFLTVLNTIISIIIAFNLLLAKQSVLNKSKKILLALTEQKFYKNTVSNLNFINSVLRNYLSAFIINSIIIGVISIIISLIFGLKNPLFIGIIFAVASFIPHYGFFIGAIPVSLLILLEKPSVLIWYLICLIAFHLIYKKISPRFIQREIKNISPVGVLIAIVIGGGFFGIWGFFLSVPFFAVLQKTVKKSVNERLEEKVEPNLEKSNIVPFKIYDKREAEKNITEKLDNDKKAPLIFRIYKFFKVLIKGVEK